MICQLLSFRNATASIQLSTTKYLGGQPRHIPNFFLFDTKTYAANPHKELVRILNFMGLGQIGYETIDEAVKFASFDNMRKMERDEKYKSEMLKPADETAKILIRHAKGG